MLQIAQLSKAYGDRVLFDRVTWQIGRRDRIGLCGPNGAGKTTLMRILVGLEEPDAGQVVRPSGATIGYLPQDGLLHAGRTLFEETQSVFAPMLQLRHDLSAMEDRMAHIAGQSAEYGDLLTRYHDAQDRYRHAGGFTIEQRVTQVLTGLGFRREDFERRTETFSGGWQMRIALASLLLQEPTLLLLDEPTNHLDLDARNWLESYLGSYPHAVIVVSHDRFFLDAVVKRIADVGLKTITDYHCNYSRYLVERDERVERLREAKRRQDDEVARMRAFIDRFRYQATKASQVQSRLKMLEKIVPIDIPPERKRVRFHFPACPRSGRLVFELKDVTKRYGALEVFGHVSLTIERGDRVALLGQNGAGKSTLMRILAGQERLDGGVRREGHEVRMSYFAQDEAARLDESHTVYEEMAAESPTLMIPAIRNILGGFLFSGDDIYKRVGVLSGGERTRLAVAKMLLRPSNALLLDEPTNHLDLDSKDVLLEALLDYGGTLLFVSHDRYFVDRLATRVIEVGKGTLEVYPGTYEELLWKKTQAASAAPPAAAPAAAGTFHVRDAARLNGNRRGAAAAVADPARGRSGPAIAPLPDKGLGARERRRREQADARLQSRAARQLRERLDALEATIAAKEAQIREIEARMASPGFYDNRDGSRQAVARHQSLMWEVGDLLSEWEHLMTDKDGSAEL